MSYKTECQVRSVSEKCVSQECSAKVPGKSVLQTRALDKKSQVRVSNRSVKEVCQVRSVKQECQVRASRLKCQVRASCKGM